MKRTSKIPTVIAYVLLAILTVAIIGLFIAQTAHNGWVVDKNDAMRMGILLVGIGLTLVKLIGKTSGPSLHKYEAVYKKEIGSAFSAPDQKSQKRALLTAIARYSQNKHNGAVARLQALRKACRTPDDYNAVLLFLALSYEDAGATDDAIATYEELVKYAPTHSTGWSNLGLLYRKKGQNDRAILCYENAVKHNPDNAFGWNNLAHAHLNANNWAKVIDPALRSIAIKTDMHQAESALCIAYYMMGEKELSRKYFDSAITHGANAQNLTQLLKGLENGSLAYSASEVREEITRAIGHLQRDTALPMVEIRLPAPDDGNNSRLGGAPVDHEVPTDSSGAPMKLLAAIWCSEVRGVPDFPTRGVLRFYVADNDLYGADFDHPTVQSDFRVLYDEDESAFDTALRDDPTVSDAFPIQHVLPVRLTPAMGSIRSSDYRFAECVNAALIKAGECCTFDELEDAENDYITEQNTYAGHRIGGYPCFEQFDPRDDEPELQKYDTLLLQIVSHIAPDTQGKEHELIMFGDLGGCQFFIPAEKLRAKDFSDILYSWDCG